MIVDYYVSPSTESPDVLAAAAAINRRLGDAGDTGNLAAVEREIAECAESLRGDLAIEELEVWEAWIDGSRDDAVRFSVSPGEDVVQAGASALNVAVSEELNVARVAA